MRLDALEKDLPVPRELPGTYAEHLSEPFRILRKIVRHLLQRPVAENDERRDVVRVGQDLSFSSEDLEQVLLEEEILRGCRTGHARGDRSFRRRDQNVEIGRAHV